MSSLPPSNNYSKYGFEPETQTQNYSEYGFEPEKKPKEKVGKVASTLYGAAEGLLAIPSLIQYGVNEWSKGLEQALGQEPSNLTYEQENPLSAILSSFPESEDETSRRLRIGASSTIASAPFGIPGIIAGLIGSQAGQTVREVYGNEGKFEDFGWGEVGAIGADIVAGGLTGIATGALRGGQRAASQTANVPAIFQSGETGLQKAVIKNTIQGEQRQLQNILNSFGQEQINGFEQQASRVSPDRYTQLTESSSSSLKRHADRMHAQGQLSMISPLSPTPEQGGRAIQEAANTVFQNEVITAERQAYGAARAEATGLSGEAPRTLEQAITLRNNIMRNNPTPEQNPVLTFLNGLIEDLQTTTPSRDIPASSLLNAEGNALIPGHTIPSSTNPTIRSANDMVDLVQRSNQAVNYESELRLQSHRLIPIVNTLRQETGNILSGNPIAQNLYQVANDLHATNSQTWGTRYMRQLRFSENPETLISKTKLASNMRNLKQGIDDPTIQALAERLVIQDITESGSHTSNRIAINELSPELSVQARNAAENLVQVKDPLTSAGGRAAIRNEILKDAAQAVNTGKRPETILDLMQNLKGYNIVRESMNGTPQSRQLFNSFERLFIEDIFSSITDKNGRIDFGKAKNILKNDETRNVVKQIGGDDLLRRFTQLEEFANNFERNLSLYQSPETISFFQNTMKNVKSAGLIGWILKALHVPFPIIASLGLAKGMSSGVKGSYNILQKKILSNPKAVRILENISRANNLEELSKQLPRLISEIHDDSQSE